MRRRLNVDRLKLEIARSRNSFIAFLGLVALGLFALFYTLHQQVFQRPFRSYYKVNAVVADAKGVVPGKQPVRIAGVPVGVITKSRLVNGQAVITLSLEEKFKPLYHNATVQLRPSTPLQDIYASVERGDPSTGALQPGSTIPVTQTITPVDISRVLQTFDLNTRQRLTVLLSELGAGLQDNGRQLQQSFAALSPFLHAADQVTRALSDRRVETKRVITNFATLSGALANTDKQLSSLITAGNQTLGELAARDVPLSSTIQQLPATMTALQGSLSTLQQAESQLDPALVSLGPVAKQLPGGLRGLGSFGRDARPALRALQPSLNALQPLAVSLRPTAAKLQTAFSTLAPQAPGFDHVTKEIANCPYTIRKFFAWTPSVTAWGDANGAIPRGDQTFGIDSLGGQTTDIALKRYPNCVDVAGGA